MTGNTFLDFLNHSIEENSTWYLYKIIKNPSRWIEEYLLTKIPWLVDLLPWLVEHIPRFSQSLEFKNLCHNSIISCWIIIYYWSSSSREQVPKLSPPPTLHNLPNILILGTNIQLFINLPNEYIKVKNKLSNAKREV